ncbi:MAG: Mrp/NBP35 family ATP-binding protein [Armatimonadetes bacterium]|nr:Mrp/NBP35 family ATP-binding protein [Armatimonadota bacterium]
MSDSWRDSYKKQEKPQEASEPVEGCGDEKECSGDCQNCPAAATASDQERELHLQEKRLQERASLIKHTYVVISGKGGVGKSTVAASLAWGFALRDKRVGLLDADLHGPTIPIMMGLSGQRVQGVGGSISPVPVFENLMVMSIGFFTQGKDDPVIWRGPLRSGVIRQFVSDVDWGPLDYLVADLPPGTGDEALTVAQMFPNAEGAIIVTTPQDVSTADCRKAANFVKAVDLPIVGIIENMSGFICPHCGEKTDIFGAGGGQAMADQLGVPLLGQVPIVADVTRLSDEGRPLLGPDAPPEVKQVYESIVERLVKLAEG